MKRIELKTGFLPPGLLEYSGEYIYKVLSYREGAGLGEGHPKPEFLDYELSGHCGVLGRLEKEIPVSVTNPLNCTIHQYYNLEHEVWIKNLGDYKYQTDWTSEEKWALAVEAEYDSLGNRIGERELGFCIIYVDRKKGILV